MDTVYSPGETHRAYSLGSHCARRGFNPGGDGVAQVSSWSFIESKGNREKRRQISGVKGDPKNSERFLLQNVVPQAPAGNGMWRNALEPVGDKPASVA
jgi:hypothetical protein